MIYFTNDDETELYALDSVEDIQFLPNHINPTPIGVTDADRIRTQLIRLVTPEHVRSDRDTRIERTVWLVQRHRDEIEAGRVTTLTNDQYVALQSYRQALRDVPEQPGFPQDVKWPVAPEWLK